MVDIEIDEHQHEYLEQLRTELADEHVGDYGHVRHRDAIQYLIDHYDSAGGEVGTAPATETPDAKESGEQESGEQGSDEKEPDGEGDEAGDETGTDPDEGDDTEADSDDGGSTPRLQRMQALLDDHDDVWERTDSEDGRYTVTLPDGSTETARTKDDVRALLFQHYD